MTDSIVMAVDDPAALRLAPRQPLPLDRGPHPAGQPGWHGSHLHQQRQAGPHLIAGGGVALLVLAKAALGPALQKGEDWARGLHVGLTGLILVLFGWQAITGIAIVNKLLAA